MFRAAFVKKNRIIRTVLYKDMIYANKSGEIGCILGSQMFFYNSSRCVMWGKIC